MAEEEKEGVMLVAIFKALILFILSSVMLYLGSWPVLEIFHVSEALSGQINVIWMILGLTLVVGLACLFGANVYLSQVLKARRLTLPLTGIEQWLHATTVKLATRSRITPPRIAIYPSSELNAFAIGTRRHRSTIVLSEGLVYGLKLQELESVLAHEVSHVANGDVQILTMLQGVLNVVVYLPAQLIDHVLSRLWPRYRYGGPVYLCCVTVMQLAMGWLASILIMRFSRACEYQADKGAVKLVGLNRMQSALRCLHMITSRNQTRQLAAFGLPERLRFGLLQLFNSHPSLSERLRALRQTG